MLVDISSCIRWSATLASPWSCRCNSETQTQNLFSALTFLMWFKPWQDSHLLPIQPQSELQKSNCQLIILKICVPAVSCENLPSCRLFFPSLAVSCVAHCGPDTVWLSCVLLFCVKSKNHSHGHEQHIVFISSLIYLQVFSQEERNASNWGNYFNCFV